MTMKSTKEPQIKTLEIALIDILKSSSSTNPVREAFRKMLTHFIDEDFLYGTSNEKLILLIYEKEFYKYHHAHALSQKLHLDVKTILTCRKNYLQLFMKYYLNVQINAKSNLVLLYSTLENEKQLLKLAT